MIIFMFFFKMTKGFGQFVVGFFSFVGWDVDVSCSMT